MTRFIPERPDIMAQMERDQENARRGGAAEDEILQYLVDKYHPTHRELRRVRDPLGNFTYAQRDERMLISDNTLRMEIGKYNRTQRLVQEIGSQREDWNVLDKVRRVWVKVLLIAKDAVMDARRRNQRMIEGAIEKDKRLADKLRNRRTIRMKADTNNALVQEAIRRGRRSRGGAGVT